MLVPLHSTDIFHVYTIDHVNFEAVQVVHVVCLILSVMPFQPLTLLFKKVPTSTSNLECLNDLIETTFNTSLTINIPIDKHLPPKTKLLPLCFPYR